MWAMTCPDNARMSNVLLYVDGNRQTIYHRREPWDAVEHFRHRHDSAREHRGFHPQRGGVLG